MKYLKLKDRKIGAGHLVYIIAEMSANHCQNFENAVQIIKAAKEAGADAIKLQTYTPDTMTIDCDKSYFKIKGTIWEGNNLYQLYKQAYTPWEWQPKLKEVAQESGIDFFSTPFDFTSVDFLETINVPAYKIASFELVDIPLIKKIARTQKPIIMSTGMASLGEIDEAVNTVFNQNNFQLALLKCTSAYPAPVEEMNLKTISHLSDAYNIPVGISDHTLTTSVAVASVALGASIVEKHFTLSRDDSSPDSKFSLEPHEFKRMVNEIRSVEKALGHISYEVTDKQKENHIFRRSLFVVENINEGQRFTESNVRSIRPAHGLHPRYFKDILGRRASKAIEKGTPLSWELIGK